MRIKLLVTAAVMAASLATSIAQNVYSLNVVGYYNISLPGDGLFYFAANQLKAGNNTLDEVLPPATAPLAANGVVINVWDPATYTFQENVTDGTTWFDNVLGTPSGTTTVLPPGAAFLVNNPGPAFALTMVGEVMQGTLTLNIGTGFTSGASLTPQELNIAANGFPQSDTLKVLDYVPSAAAYNEYVTDGSGQWYDNILGTPITYAMPVGRGYLFENSSGGVLPWTRNFTVE